MKILVTGGTGFVGRHLVRTLVQEGAFVRMLVRKTSNIDDFKNLGVEFVYGDITERRSLAEIGAGIDVLFHLAAQVGKWGITENQFYAINVQGTWNLLETSLGAEIKQFIFCSTPGVQGKGYSQARETLPYNPPYIYEHTKCKAEKLALAFYKSRNLPVTIIRPDFVYGPGDLRRLTLYRAIRDKRFHIIGSGKSFLHPTYIDDAIQGFLLVINNPVAFGEIYNIAGPRLLTVNEYVESIAHTLKASPPRLKLPKPVAVAAAWAFETLSKINGQEPFVTRSKIEFLTNSHGSDISKAQSHLGYQPAFDLQEGMQLTIRWYQKHGLL